MGGTGRYSFSMISDALPPDIDGDNTFDDVISQYGEPLGTALVRAEFDLAREIVLGTTGAGDGRNYLALPNAAFQVRSYDVTPSGWAVTQFQELGVIERINDYDIYFFRAPDNGMTEIRLATKQITDEFVEYRDDLNTLASPRRAVHLHQDLRQPAGRPNPRLQQRPSVAGRQRRQPRPGRHANQPAHRIAGPDRRHALRPGRHAHRRPDLLGHRSTRGHPHRARRGLLHRRGERPAGRLPEQSGPGRLAARPLAPTSC
ncbi:MAG: hypothetical protein KatS3mg103_0588 [Phycisphaerales bacterium]|nr:MAG: hypothetical protein KatS3mg103_0588 [Phycisphaerales bacterium]